MQQCKLIIFSNFYCILSCCLNLFFMSNMLFCMYILFTMHICILLCIHVTVLYYILASFQKNKMLMLMFNKQYWKENLRNSKFLQNTEITKTDKFWKTKYCNFIFFVFFNILRVKMNSYYETLFGI